MSEFESLLCVAFVFSVVSRFQGYLTTETTRRIEIGTLPEVKRPLRFHLVSCASIHALRRSRRLRATGSSSVIGESA